MDNLGQTPNTLPTRLLQGILLAVVFFTPLIYTAATRELFEFPKMSFIYLTTILAAAAFLWQSGDQVRLGGGAKKVHLGKTPWDKALLFFLVSYLLSTLFSLDRYTSLFGYYSRFNGGLFSVLCFTTLYYLFNQQLADKRFVRKTLYALFLAAFLVSLLGIAQHFGYQREQWVQDSAARVFSTLGQPNWLAAFLVMLLPLTLAFLLLAPSLGWRAVFFLLTSALYAAFWFTYSLSGLISLLFAFFVFFLTSEKSCLYQKRKALLLMAVTFLFISLSQPGIFAPRLKSFFKQISQTIIPPLYAATSPSPAYEGDTFKIRTLVWQGGLAAWQQDFKTLLLGYGPETFAYAFLPYRPAALNLTSEWDFLYNKAHNDYVDTLVNRGLLGLSSFMYLLFSFSFYVKSVLNKKGVSSFGRTLTAALYAGWVGLLISNFFGWSVVATSLLFWLFPLLVFRLTKFSEKEGNALF